MPFTKRQKKQGTIAMSFHKLIQKDYFNQQTKLLNNSKVSDDQWYLVFQLKRQEINQCNKQPVVFMTETKFPMYI